MNTIRSTAYGWGVLIVAGGGAYVFAKKQINAERAEKAATDRRRKEQQQRLEASAYMPSSNTTGAVPMSAADATGPSASPSQQASQDPAPTRHAPETEGQRVFEKSKYEAAEPFRSRKGDRFS
ncbi:uncharacterized protein K452DRAFT_274057 [Aplosporella prunicola CBS 121167]|uniref:Uncharacterized protein n=1 Tax=Aplosporella prunicola CBS 121167 TaxID=1176127 RepID=A0A6A6B8D2_9PEZI|nr:uncharacterized protein K452DRAFT_274057 [Aplosporella prunicola CBS 121167]KAF2140350.1 hypothetical protein K452DRAFT_274057 [Aplosporella prunicola CBS 121167]